MKKKIKLLKSKIKNQVIRKLLELKFWLLKKLFTDDEKHLIKRAIDDRVDKLERIAVTEPWADRDLIRIDCCDYLKLKKVFSTKEWV